MASFVRWGWVWGALLGAGCGGCSESGGGVVEARRGVVLAVTRDTVDVHRRDVAFLFGSNRYRYWPDLNNATEDVRAVGDVLKKRYGFEVHAFFNLTKKAFIEAVRKIRDAPFGTHDQVLVFVAGHGHYSPALDAGFIVPVDALAASDDPHGRSMLNAAQVVQRLNESTTRHLLLVLDVCYGGAFIRSANAGGRAPEPAALRRYVSDVFGYKTRRWIAASDRWPVSDGPSGRSSPFTRRFLEALQAPAKDDIRNINDVMARIDRVGETRPVSDALVGNEAGSDFLFIGPDARAALAVRSTAAP